MKIQVDKKKDKITLIVTREQGSYNVGVDGVIVNAIQIVTGAKVVVSGKIRDPWKMLVLMLSKVDVKQAEVEVMRILTEMATVTMTLSKEQLKAIIGP